MSEGPVAPAPVAAGSPGGAVLPQHLRRLEAEAIAILQAGGLVAMPTDTVYGLGVALGAEDGLKRLFAAKFRPLDRAIVLLAADLEQAGSIGVLSPAARALAASLRPAAAEVPPARGSRRR